MVHGDGSIGHGQAGLLSNIGRGRAFQQLLQWRFVQALHISIGQALPVFAWQLTTGCQRRQGINGLSPVVQLLGPVCPRQAQNSVVAFGRQVVEPVQGPGCAAEFGQAQAVGLPQADTLVQGTVGNPAFYLTRARWILLDPGQAQLQQGIGIGGAGLLGQRLGIAVAALVKQRLDQ
ncbi:hypothetical protein D3C77_307860 [compost metagenome]